MFNPMSARYTCPSSTVSFQGRFSAKKALAPQKMQEDVAALGIGAGVAAGSWVVGSTLGSIPIIGPVIASVASAPLSAGAVAASAGVASNHLDDIDDLKKDLKKGGLD